MTKRETIEVKSEVVGETGPGVRKIRDTLMPRAIADGVISFGPLELECYVLDDERRILTTSGIQEVIGAAKDRMLTRALSRLPKKYEHLSVQPSIEFVLPNGGIGTGREAMFLVELCKAYAEAWQNGELHHKQEHIAKTAMTILFALSGVAIIALIDEKTGYQSKRQSNYLERLFNHSLRVEARRWELMFPDSVAKALAPLWGVAYVGGSHPKELHRVYGIIYDIVLGRDVADEMRKRKKSSGKSVKNHQFLQDDSRMLLSDDLRVVELLARQSQSKQDFLTRLRHHYRQEGLQLSFTTPPQGAK